MQFQEGDNSSNSNIALVMYLGLVYYIYTNTCSEECGRGNQVRGGITDWGRSARWDDIKWWRYGGGRDLWYMLYVNPDYYTKLCNVSYVM